MSPILFNFNQFNNCPFFLPNYFVTLFSCLVSKSSWIEPQLLPVCLSVWRCALQYFYWSPGPSTCTSMPRKTLGTSLLPPTHFFLKVTVVKIEKALINDRLRVSKVFWKFHIPTIYNFAVIYPWNSLFSSELAYFLAVSIVFFAYK